jgi:hypothetical protein
MKGQKLHFEATFVYFLYNSPIGTDRRFAISITAADKPFATEIPVSVINPQQSAVYTTATWLYGRAERYGHF